jgi:hypothetical protein
MDCFWGECRREHTLILWLTSLLAASYANVGIYRIQKVMPVRIALSPPAVWVAEKFGCIPRKIARNGRNSADFALKQDRRKCSALLRMRDLWLFSLKGPLAVRFQELREANIMRSQIDEAAKAWVTGTRTMRNTVNRPERILAFVGREKVGGICPHCSPQLRHRSWIDVGD